MDAVERFIHNFLRAKPEYVERNPDDIDVYFFTGSFNRESANMCAALAARGIKTAASSLLWEYEILDREMPEVGNLAVITDWDDNPACVIEVVHIEVKPFDEVDEMHAYKVGEGDRSLESWRKAHWDSFSRVCEEMGVAPSEKMLVVQEEFRVVYKETSIH